MKEKDIQVLFSKKIDKILECLSKTNLNNASYIFELKICKEDRFLFSNVKNHQINALLNANSDIGVYYKINDQPFIKDNKKMRFTNKKPFDCLFIRGMAFVVICWYKERKMKQLHFISIINFEDKKIKSKMKSMTYDESVKISTLIYNLNAK